MRVSAIFLILAAALCVTPCARAWDVDLTDKPESTWHHHVGKVVLLRGKVYFWERFGPAVSAGNGPLYIRHADRALSLEPKEEVLLEGRLRYQPPTRVKGRSDVTPGYFYTLAQETVIRVSTS
jgi:hypothetical protein